MKKHHFFIGQNFRAVWLLIPLAAVVVVLLAACGGTTTTTSGGSTPTAVPATAQPTQATASGTTATIKMIEQNNKYMFSPQSITVKVGTKVVWTNNSDAPHTVTSDNNAFTASQALSEKQMFSQTFTKAGTYTYHCSIHSYMKATVIVQP
ncbi:MAG TPA: plastocyanin/azurin family copper-binding protein [Ktedonobacteraceae bacterium]|nr:plastocyanin/azurin family copper-binding protein [Ktedonobacteraceae bacterium]